MLSLKKSRLPICKRANGQAHFNSNDLEVKPKMLSEIPCKPCREVEMRRAVKLRCVTPEKKSWRTATRRDVPGSIARIGGRKRWKRGGFLGRNDAVEKGSVPASGAVSRASRVTQGREIDSAFSVSARFLVRPEAGRTAAGAAALPEEATALFR